MPKTLKPVGDRVLLKIKLVEKKNAEGQKFTDLDREAKVLESNNRDIKKGATVYYNPRGCIQIETMKGKGFVVLIIDAQDVYGFWS
jgi:co-chaperonin GroES (HSP10)